MNNIERCRKKKIKEGWNPYHEAYHPYDSTQNCSSSCSFSNSFE